MLQATSWSLYKRASLTSKTEFVFTHHSDLVLNEGEVPDTSIQLSGYHSTLFHESKSTVHVS